MGGKDVLGKRQRVEAGLGTEDEGDEHTGNPCVSFSISDKEYALSPLLKQGRRRSKF